MHNALVGVDMTVSIGELVLEEAARDNRIVYLRNQVNVDAAANYSNYFKPLGCEFFRWTKIDDIPEATLVEKCLYALQSDPSAVLDLTEPSFYGNVLRMQGYPFRRRFHYQASNWDRNDTEKQLGSWDPLPRKPSLGSGRSLMDFSRAISDAPRRLHKDLAVHVLG